MVSNKFVVLVSTLLIASSQAAPVAQANQAASAAPAAPPVQPGQAQTGAQPGQGSDNMFANYISQLGQLLPGQSARPQAASAAQDPPAAQAPQSQAKSATTINQSPEGTQAAMAQASHIVHAIADTHTSDVPSPLSSTVINSLQGASDTDIGLLSDILTNGINGVITVAQQSNQDNTQELNEYVTSVGQSVEAIQAAKGAQAPAQLTQAYQNLQNYVASYKPPPTRSSASYGSHKRQIGDIGDSTQNLQTSQTGLIGNSEGTAMYAPLANDINGLIQSDSMAGDLYKAFDSVDHVVDGTAGAIGNALAPLTGGVSTGVSSFLTGPIVQSLTHGTFDTISHLVGTPVDTVSGTSELSPADAASQNSGNSAGVTVNNDSTSGGSSSGSSGTQAQN